MYKIYIKANGDTKKNLTENISNPMQWKLFVLLMTRITTADWTKIYDQFSIWDVQQLDSEDYLLSL